MTEIVFGTTRPLALRRVLVTAAVLLLFALVLVTPAAAEDTHVEITPDYSGYGDGTTDTFTINSIEQLAGLAKITQANVVVDEGTTITKTNFAGKTVKLSASLTFADNQYWYYNDGTTPVYDYRVYDFAGTFNGNGKNITGLQFYYTSSTNSNLGLFHTITGSVSDLTLDTVTAEFTNTNKPQHTFGAIAYKITGTASNCHVKNVSVTTSGSLRHPGGMFSHAGGTASVSYCTAENVTLTSVSGFEDVGGLIAVVEGSASVTNCEVDTVQINCGGKAKKAGGLIGRTNVDSRVSECSATNVTISCSTLDTVGGFIGHAEKNTGGITNCDVSKVTITATIKSAKTGGFVGEAAQVVLEKCRATTVIMNIGDEVTDSHGATGGFVGQSNTGAVTMNNCHVTGLQMTVYGNPESAIGGFITATGNSITLTDCSSSGTIDATMANETKPVGGFLGDTGWGGAPSVIITGCTADVDIKAKGPAGGFVARAEPNQSIQTGATLSITDSTANGDVESITGAAGGFVGIGDRGSFTSCTANGAVSGVTAGGFWGELSPNDSSMENKDVTITDCDATGQVLGTETASGFVGTVTTTKEDGSNPTAVKIENSEAAPVVAGASSTTEVNSFAKTKEEDTNYQPAGNTNAKETVKVAEGDTPLTMENGEIHIPAGTTIDKTVQLENGEPKTETIIVQTGGTVDDVGEIIGEGNRAESAISLTTTQFTYGGTIDLTVEITKPAEPELLNNAKSSRSAAQPDTIPHDMVRFLYAGTLFGEVESTYGEDHTHTTGTATLSYDTTNGVLPIGQDVAITVEYGGSVNLAPSTATLTINIAKKQLTVEGLTVSDKIYDGTTDITVTDNGELAGVVTGDDVSIESITATVSDANVGTNKPVTIAITLTGADSGNYTIAPPTDRTVNITPADSTVTGTTIEAIYGDTISLSVEITQTAKTRSANQNTVVFKYGDTELGTAPTSYKDNIITAPLPYDTTDGKIPIGTHTITATFGGSDNLVGSVGQITVTLNQKTLTIDGVDAVDRQYNSGTTVYLTGGQLVGVEPEDTNKVSAKIPETGTISSANVGSYSVTFDPITLEGGKAGFYQLTQPTVDVTTSNAENIITLHANHDEGCTHESKATITFNSTYTAIKYGDGAESVYPPQYSDNHQHNGYTLDGWYTEKVGGVMVIDADGKLISGVDGYTTENGVWENFGTVQLWAHWKPNTTTITLDATGGTFDTGGTTTTTTATYNGAVSPFTPPTKIHDGDLNRTCHLLGWYTAPTGGTKVLMEDGALVEGTGYSRGNVWTYDGAALTLYAQWNHDNTPYFVDIYKEALDGTYVPEQRHQEGGYLGEQSTYNPPDREGFTYDPNNENNVKSGIVSGDENNPLVLKFYYTRNTYQVTLNAGEGVESVTLGDGSAATVTGTYKYEQPVTIEMTFKDGYEFYHWHISEGNPVDDISKNPDTFNMPAHPVTYTAHAKATIYTITYELDDGLPNTANPTQYTIESTVSFTKTHKDGYTFDGWYLDQEFTEPTTGWVPGVMTEHVTVYAKWRPNTIPYTVEHYKAEIGGYTLAETLTLTGNIDTQVTAEPKPYNGYIYNAEKSAPTASGTLTEGSSVVLKLYYDQLSTLTLNANHDADCEHSSTATITFNGDTTTVKYGDGEQSIYPPQYPSYPGNKGYTLDGWYTAKDGGVMVIDDKGNLLPNVNGYTENGVWTGGNKNLWAHWKANTTTITLNADGDGDENGITPGAASVIATYAQPLPAFEAPTKIHDGDPNRHCLLAGWYTEKYGGGTKVLNSTGFLIADRNGYSNSAGQWTNESAELTLYAHWNHDPIPYTVNIHKETLTDGTYDAESHPYGGYIDQQITYEDEYTGFTYEDGKSTNTGTVKADGSLVLDLYYKRNSYEVTLNAGDGVESVTLGNDHAATVTGTYKYEQPVTIEMTIKDGYEFYHWHISEGNPVDDISENPDTFKMPAHHVTYTAHAKPTIYTITYELDGGQTNTANPTQYTIESFVGFTKTQKDGFIFDGWYLDAAFTQPTIGWNPGEQIGNVIVYAKWLIDYPISDDSTQIIEQGQPATFISAADQSKFVEVEIDNNVIDGSNYDITEGSTKVTLKGSYVETLSVGEHSIIIRSNDGEARTTFTVTEATIPVTSSSPSSGSQGSSVWLTETPTPTPTTTPTATPTDPELAPTGIPTTQPTQTETTSPVSIAAALAGLGAALVLRRNKKPLKYPMKNVCNRQTF